MAANGTSSNDNNFHFEVIELSDDEEKAPNQTDAVDPLKIQPAFTSIVDKQSLSGEDETTTKELCEHDSNKPVFSQFIAECSKYLQLPADQPIIAKLEKHYQSMDQEHTNSPKFLNILQNCTENIVKNSSQVYVFIQDLLHEMKILKSGPSKKIRRLEKWLAQVDREIKKQQEREVNWDDDDRSAYIYECQLKKKFMDGYQKLLELTGCEKICHRIAGNKYKYSGTRYPEVNKNITKFIRKRNVFPDYTEIVNIVRETNEKGRFLSEEGILQLAKEAFIEVGEELKQYRLREFRSTIDCYLTDSVEAGAHDPAASDEELRLKLDQNKELAKMRLDEVIEKYAEEQVRLKLEPKEEGDGFDDGSEEDVEDEEEESSEAENDSVLNDPSHRNGLDLGDSNSLASSSTSNGHSSKDQDAPTRTVNVEEPSAKKRRVDLESVDDIIILD